MTSMQNSVNCMMKNVGKWKPLTPKWEEMVTKMFVEIRNYYEKDGKTWSPLETH